MRNDEIETRLAEISDILVNASTCFDVWHEMQDGRKRTVYEPVVNEYPLFFETTVVAHLIAISTSLYSILETRRDTHNIPELVRAMRGANLDEVALSAVEARVAELHPIWTRLARVRNEVFGHRASERFPSHVFSEIQLLPDELGHVIQQLKKIINTLAVIANTNVSKALTMSATEDTQRLMSCLVAKNAP